MATFLTITPEHTLDLPDSVTQQPIPVEKVIDLTADCPKAGSQRCILLYGRDTQGVVWELCRPCEGSEYKGPKIHFLLENLDRLESESPPRDLFGAWANELGLTKRQLRQLIEEHAPA